MAEPARRPIFPQRILTAAEVEEDACYSCGASEDYVGFPGESVLVCPQCEASYQHQRRLREEYEVIGGPKTPVTKFEVRR